jgi:hypothetical protein
MCVINTRLPPDVMCMVCSFLDTSDIARIPWPLPDASWTEPLQHRCGNRWCAGREGLAQLHNAVRLGTLPPYGAIAAGDAAVCRVDLHELRVWGSNGIRSLQCHSGQVFSVALIGDTLVAVGGTFGLVVHNLATGERHQCFYGLMDPVVSVAVLDAARLVFCTSCQLAYTYHLPTRTLARLYDHVRVSCVSGPRLFVGTVFGTYPRTSIFVPCTAIHQTATVVAARHADGHIVTFCARTLRKLHMFDAGIAVGAFSVIGDVVCVHRTTWRNGTRYGHCPAYTRCASADGRHYISSATGDRYVL